MIFVSNGLKLFAKITNAVVDITFFFHKYILYVYIPIYAPISFGIKNSSLIKTRGKGGQLRWVAFFCKIFYCMFIFKNI